MALELAAGSATVSPMLKAADALEATLVPELAALHSLDADAANERRTRMAANGADFCRGSLGLHALWLARTIGVEGPWVWAVGDPHQGNFSTLATGTRNRYGICPVTYGVADVDDEHPAPWRWDILRLLGSVPSARRLSRARFIELAQIAITWYRRTLEQVRDDDESTLRIDMPNLPEPLQLAIAHGNDPEKEQRFRAKHISGDDPRAKGACLNPAKHALPDAQARAFFTTALERMWSKRKILPKFQILDVAKRFKRGGLSSLGRRRWMMLIREKDRADAWHPRLVELKELRPSGLAHFFPVIPFDPSVGAARSLTVAMGGDPYQAIIHAPAGEVLARTRCHTRAVIDLNTCDDVDMKRLMQVWGQLLAQFHVTGLRQLRVDLPTHLDALITDINKRQRDSAAEAWELSRFCAQAFVAFTKNPPDAAD